MIGTILHNLFRFTGDFFHLYTIYILLQKIKTTKSVSGLSLKTQFLYLLVFIFRYLDIFIFNVSSLLQIYNFVMKILYTTMQVYLCYLMRYKYYYSYNVLLDTMNILNLIIPCSVLSPFLKPYTKNIISYFVELLYTFSILLESVAILPQLIQLQESGESETLTSRYIFFLGLYRMFYVFNWIIKYFIGKKIDHLLLASGIIQTLLYADFFVIYYKYVFIRQNNEKIPSRVK